MSFLSWVVRLILKKTSLLLSVTFILRCPVAGGAVAWFSCGAWSMAFDERNSSEGQVDLLRLLIVRKLLLRGVLVC